MGKRKAVMQQPRRVLRVQEHEKKTEISTIDDIPNEMLHQILEKLPPKDKKSALLVSKRWNSVQELSVSYSMSLTRDTLEYFRKRKYNLNELRVVLNQVIPCPIPPMLKKSIKTAKTLHFMAEKYAITNRPNHLHPLGVIDGKGVERLLKACNQIESLKFDFRFLEVYLMTSALNTNKIRLPFLTSLQVKLAARCCTEVANAMFRLETPCLQNLSVESFSATVELANEDNSIYRNMLRFMARNNSTLRGLRLSRILSTPNGNRLMFRDGLEEQLLQVRLDRLEIYFKNSDFGTASFIGPNLLLSNQRSLKTVKLHTDSNSLIRFISRLITANAGNLEILELNLEDSADFDMEVLSHLTALKTLSFTSDDARYGFFPTTLQHLTWNAPLSHHWGAIKTGILYPNLITLTFGPCEPGLMFKASLFDDIFFIHPNSADRTNSQMKLVNIRRHGNSIEEIFRDFDLELLPSQIYKIEVDYPVHETVVHISLH